LKEPKRAYPTYVALSQSQSSHGDQRAHAAELGARPETARGTGYRPPADRGAPPADHSREPEVGGMTGTAPTNRALHLMFRFTVRRWHGEAGMVVNIFIIHAFFVGCNPGAFGPLTQSV